MIYNPKDALDYPHIPDDKWVIWWWNNHPWPDANRQLGYLSTWRVHPLKGCASYVIFATQAKLFDTKQGAEDWRTEQEKLRGYPYYNTQITTVAELKIKCGYHS